MKEVRYFGTLQQAQWAEVDLIFQEGVSDIKVYRDASRALYAVSFVRPFLDLENK